MAGYGRGWIILAFAGKTTDHLKGHGKPPNSAAFFESTYTAGGLKVAASPFSGPKKNEEYGMAKIGILTCSNATQDLGCSSVSCLADFRRRKGTFADYPSEEKLTLMGIINCPGCPTLTGSDKLIQRIRALTDFGVDRVHFSYCMKALCPFKEKYRDAIDKAFPNMKIVIGTHEEHVAPEEFRRRVKQLFCQPRKTMVDIILNKDEEE